MTRTNRTSVQHTPTKKNSCGNRCDSNLSFFRSPDPWEKARLEFGPDISIHSDHSLLGPLASFIQSSPFSYDEIPVNEDESPEGLPNLRDPPEEWFASKNQNIDTFFAEAFKLPKNEQSQSQCSEINYSPVSEKTLSRSSHKKKAYDVVVRVPATEFYTKEEQPWPTRRKPSNELPEDESISYMKASHSKKKVGHHTRHRSNSRSSKSEKESYTTQDGLLKFFERSNASDGTVYHLPLQATKCRIQSEYTDTEKTSSKRISLHHKRSLLNPERITQDSSSILNTSDNTCNSKRHTRKTRSCNYLDSFRSEPMTSSEPWSYDLSKDAGYLSANERRSLPKIPMDSKYTESKSNLASHRQDACVDLTNLSLKVQPRTPTVHSKSHKYLSGRTARSNEDDKEVSVIANTSLQVHPPTPIVDRNSKSQDTSTLNGIIGHKYIEEQDVIDNTKASLLVHPPTPAVHKVHKPQRPKSFVHISTASHFQHERPIAEKDRSQEGQLSTLMPVKTLNTVRARPKSHIVKPASYSHDSKKDAIKSFDSSLRSYPPTASTNDNDKWEEPNHQLLPKLSHQKPPKVTNTYPITCELSQQKKIDLSVDKRAKMHALLQHQIRRYELMRQEVQIR
ncbi:hypothetical protein K7432_013992 [Basidiobolus ranarum]|uniref:Uncharacterized protein n=1 Tax=Basidiobolus ranarum TaxID=34480 RepID=A0ABR2VQ21_9FUNG